MTVYLTRRTFTVAGITSLLAAGHHPRSQSGVYSNTYSNTY